MEKNDFLKLFEQRSKGAPLDDSDKNFIEGIYEGISKMVGLKLTDEQLENQVRSITSTLKLDVPEEFKEQIRNAIQDIEKLKSQKTRDSIERNLNLRQTLEGVKDDILHAVSENGKHKGEISLNFIPVRAAAMHTTTTVATSVNTQNSFSDNVGVDDVIDYIRYPKDFIIEVISSRRVSKVKESMILKKQLAVEGSAEVTAEGDVKPLVSYTFSDKIVKRKKIAAHIEFTEEFEMDFERLYNDILYLFEFDVIRKWQDYVLSEIIAAAPAYVSTALDGTIVSPDIYAVIMAMKTHISNMNYDADFMAMSPSTYAMLTLSQGTDGHYKMAPYQLTGTIVTNNKIPDGKILMGQSDTWREEHSGFIIRMGWINEQFIENEKSVVGEIFTLMMQHDQALGSWLYGDIATIQAALLKV